MAGNDEARARAVLAAMQERLGQGPHVVFGLPSPTPEDVRASFLALTKVYHPARFARMSVDLQRQSNEIFLGIKAALEAITKSMPGAPSSRGTGSIRQLTPPSATSQPVPRVASPPTARPAAARPGTPPSATSAPIAPPTTPMPRSPMSRSGPMPRIEPPTRTASPSPAPAPMPIAPRAPAAARFNATRQTAPGVPAIDERGQLVIAHDMLQKQQWAAAKTALDTLLKIAPESKQYRALVCYASARQAQVERRDGDARVELQQALQIDPDLALAKSALAELFNRRK